MSTEIINNNCIKQLTILYKLIIRQNQLPQYTQLKRYVLTAVEAVEDTSTIVEWTMRQLLYIVGCRKQVTQMMWRNAVNFIIEVLHICSSCSRCNDMKQMQDGAETSLLMNFWNRLLKEVFSKDRSIRLSILNALHSTLCKILNLGIKLSNRLQDKHVELLISLFHISEDVETKRLALRLLVSFQNSGVVQSLFLSVLSSEYAVLRKDIISSIEIQQYNETNLLDSLIERTLDVSPDVRKSIYVKFKSVFDILWVTHRSTILMNGLNDRVEEVRQSCFRMMKEWIEVCGGVTEFISNMYAFDVNNEEILELCVSSYLVYIKKQESYAELTTKRVMDSSLHEIVVLRLHLQITDESWRNASQDIKGCTEYLRQLLMQHETMSCDNTHVLLKEEECRMGWSIRQIALLCNSFDVHQTSCTSINDLQRICVRALQTGPIEDAVYKLLNVGVSKEVHHTIDRNRWPSRWLCNTSIHAVLKLMRRLEYVQCSDEIRGELQLTEKISRCVAEIMQPFENNSDDILEATYKMIPISDLSMDECSLNKLTKLCKEMQLLMEEMEKTNDVYSIQRLEMLERNRVIIEGCLRRKWTRIMLIVEAFFTTTESHTKDDASLAAFPSTILLPALSYVVEFGVSKECDAYKHLELLYLLITKCSVNFCFISNSTKLLEKQICGLFASSQTLLSQTMELTQNQNFNKNSKDEEDIYLHHLKFELFLRCIGDLLLLHPTMESFQQSEDILKMLCKIVFGEIMTTKHIQSIALRVSSKLFLLISSKLHSTPQSNHLIDIPTIMKGLIEICFISPTLTYQQLRSSQSLYTTTCFGYSSDDKLYAINLILKISLYTRGEAIGDAIELILIDSIEVAYKFGFEWMDCASMFKFLISEMMHQFTIHQMTERMDKYLRGLLLLMLELPFNINESCGLHFTAINLLHIWMKEGEVDPHKSLLQIKLQTKYMEGYEENEFDEIRKIYLLFRECIQRHVVKQKNNLFALQKEVDWMKCRMQEMKKQINLKISSSSFELSDESIIQKSLHNYKTLIKTRNRKLCLRVPPMYMQLHKANYTIHQEQHHQQHRLKWPSRLPPPLDDHSDKIEECTNNKKKRNHQQQTPSHPPPLHLTIPSKLSKSKSTKYQSLLSLPTQTNDISTKLKSTGGGSIVDCIDVTTADV